MTAKTSCGTGIVPVNRVSVKRAIGMLLDGLPIRSEEFSAVPDEAMSGEEFMVAFARLFVAGREATVRTRFKIGDLWNRLHRSEFRQAKRTFMSGMKAKMDQESLKSYLRQLRKLGCVANKWPESSRSDKYCWTHYVMNADGKAVKPVSDGLPFYCAVKKMDNSDGDWYECAGSGDRRIIVRIPAVLEDAE